MSKEIHLIDKDFVPYISEEKILARVKVLSSQIRVDYGTNNVLFLSVLNGSFMFTSDLMKNMEGEVELSFIKLSSYEGTSTSGKVHELIGLNQNIQGRHIVVLEDIVDTGLTVQRVITMLKMQNPLSIEVCTLLYKPEAFKGDTAPKYFGFKIPNKFVVGYGLDYDQLGRNFNEIYQLKD
jgi:hypoxanthine phosphoribosyltransferase